MPEVEDALTPEVDDAVAVAVAVASVASLVTSSPPGGQAVTARSAPRQQRW